MILLLLFLLLLPLTAEATPIGDAAAKLSPGQWVKVTAMSNVGITGGYPAWDPSGNAGPGFDSWQPGWDSTAKKLYIVTAEHNVSTNCPGSFPTYPHVCWKPMWTYDDATDNWNVGATGTWTGSHAGSPVTVTGVFPHTGTSTPVNTFHAWNHVAWDNVNKVLYIGGQYGVVPATGHRYCVSNTTPSWCVGKGGTWSPLPTGPTQRSGGYPQAAVFHEGLNSSTGGTLLYYDGVGWGIGCGGLYGFRESTGAWYTISETNCGLTTGGANTIAAYSHVKQVAIFGGGNSAGSVANPDRKIYKIDSAGTIAQLTDAPCPVSTTNGGFAMPSEDPVSGDFYFIACDKQMWRLNPDGSGTWTLIDSSLAQAGEICNVLRNTNDFCALDIYATPISNYGVIGYWKFLFAGSGPHTAEFWIYKASASSGDTTAPTVSVTAPTGGATVSTTVTLSATAADNVGVVGVQFKIDGTNVGSEDTTSPYSISWDSTTVANGTHTITAVARDAAGNGTTSSAVSVTVTNAGGGSDFTTRCGLPGVVLCIGFDSPTDIANTAFGSNRGIDPNGVSIPTIDSTVKASGNSSIKFVIPSNSGANTSGEYWANFSTDLNTQYGPNSDFYVQWRQRFTSCFLFAGSAEPCTGAPRVYSLITGEGGWKQVIVGTGDMPGCTPATSTNESPRICWSSCSPLETVTQNTSQRGFPQAYNSCTGSSSTQSGSISGSSPGGTPPFYGFNEPISFGSDYKFQNNRPTPFCLYSQRPGAGAGFFPPNGNCFPYYPNEWMTFKMRITTGPRVADYFQGSYVRLWVAREGQASELLMVWGPFDLAAGPVGDNHRYGKIHLLPYHTNKNPAETHPVGTTWYDELIVSEQDIPDPSTGTSPHVFVPVSFKIQ